MKLNWKFKGGGGGGWIFFKTTTHNIGLINNSTIFTELEENNIIFLSILARGLSEQLYFLSFYFLLLLYLLFTSVHFHNHLSNYTNYIY